MIYDSELTTRGVLRKQVVFSNDDKLHAEAKLTAFKDISKSTNIDAVGYKISAAHINMNPKKFKDLIPHIQTIQIP